MTQETKDKLKMAAVIYSLPVLSAVFAVFDCKTVSIVLFWVWFVPFILLFLFARRLKDYTDRKIEEVKREKERLKAELHPTENSKW
jgi:hypothetical protein